ncbi:translation elongation factor Ts [Candidatus Roizmanbacteria bacterium]|nr:translation elongation factor Ts [Candidatus Roizmanbacteria bacterium]
MDIKLIKQLREETGVSIADIKRALEESKNDTKKAKELLRQWGLQKAAKKGDRVTEQGIVSAYIHGNGSVGALVSLACETDFVARTDDFKNLAKEIAMQVAAMSPKNVDELMKQAYIRDPKVTIEDLVKEQIAKLGENIQVKDFSRQAV